MRKISTLFKKNPADLGRVINEINPDNEWVIISGYATRKYDGTACAIIKGELYKRYDAKKGKIAPEGAIPCQEADEITGHHPHWVKCERSNNADKYFFEALDEAPELEDGTYELCGPKIQDNPEGLSAHYLIRHGSKVLDIKDFTFEGLKRYLTIHDMEGIVFHSLIDDKMCKIRKSDFCIKRIK